MMNNGSLRDDFEVTNHELNMIVDIARKHRGCLGARMTGAGFGGATAAGLAGAAGAGGRPDGKSRRAAAGRWFGRRCSCPRRAEFRR